MLKAKSEIINGRKRIIFSRQASGVDKTKEAVLKVMGGEWEYKKSEA